MYPNSRGLMHLIRKRAQSPSVWERRTSHCTSLFPKSILTTSIKRERALEGKQFSKREEIKLLPALRLVTQDTDKRFRRGDSLPPTPVPKDTSTIECGKTHFHWLGTKTHDTRQQQITRTPNANLTRSYEAGQQF